jgi:4-hydroxybenzoate polyprenyltransferase
MTNTLSVWHKIILWKQSIFGLPWMLAGALLPYSFPENQSLSIFIWLYMVLAFLAARASGMCFNRLIDHHIDAENPRTAKRPLPNGELSRVQVLLGGFLLLAIFFFATCKINSLCFMLSPLVAFLLILYSFTKRFTVLCHYVLALIHCLSPMCAWIAVTASFSYIPVFLGLALGFSIAANDIIYACQDIEFDRSKKLFSIPARFGQQRAIAIAKFSHAASFVLLLSLGILAKLSFIYFTGVVAIGAVFVCTYSKIQEKPLAELFSWSNSASSIIFLSSIICELIWRG